jgi:hypothetical protein
MELSGGYGAGAAANELKEMIAAARLHQINTQRGQDQQQADQQGAYQSESLGLQRRTADRADEQSKLLNDQRTANLEQGQQRALRIARIIQDPNTPPAVKLALQYQDATGDNAPSGIFEKPEPVAPPPQAVMRVNPRTGKMEQIGEAPKGAHFVNEPAPPQAPQNKFSFQPGTDANGKPMMYRVNQQTGESSAVNLGEGVTAGRVTDAQSSLGLYAKRVEQAEPTLTGLQKHITAMNPVAYAAMVRADHPVAQTKEVQQYQQASRNFINSVLRRESGAVISPTEFAEARAQYIPGPGDSDEVLAQKAENRATVGVEFQRGAGAAYQKKPAAGGGGGGGAPKKGDVKKFPNGRTAIWDGSGQWLAQ